MLTSQGISDSYFPYSCPPTRENEKNEVSLRNGELLRRPCLGPRGQLAMRGASARLKHSQGSGSSGPQTLSGLFDTRKP